MSNDEKRQRVSSATSYKSRAAFLKSVINPLIAIGFIERRGAEESKTTVYAIKSSQ